MVKYIEVFMLSGKEIINLIDLLLAERDDSRKNMCEKLNISLSTLTNWKARDIIPPVDSLSDIAHYLNVDLEYLIYDELPRTPYELNSLDINMEPESVIDRIAHKLFLIKPQFRNEISNFYDTYLSKSKLNKNRFISWYLGELSFLPIEYMELSRAFNINLDFLLGYEEKKLESDNSIFSLYKDLTSEDQEFVVNFMKRLKK